MIPIKDEKFRKDGFLIIPNYFPIDLISEVEKAITYFFQMQAAKIKEYQSLKRATLQMILEVMEEKDKEALYQVQKLLPYSPAFHPLIRAVSNGFAFDPCELYDGPALFINRPNTFRLLYKWHSEEHYYPKRRDFLNFWFPLFGDRTKGNGAMSFKMGSHKQHYPFAEYVGYDKDTQDKRNHFVQYEIPENFLDEFAEKFCECKRGDLVVFHSNLVHRSNQNTSAEYAFSGILRRWNPSSDLTLSGTFAAQPYGKDVGRPGLIASPLKDTNKNTSILQWLS